VGPVDSGVCVLAKKSLKVDELAKAESGVDDSERSVVRTGVIGRSQFFAVYGNETTFDRLANRVSPEAP